MEETRVKKYEKYRNSFVTDDARGIEETPTSSIDTSTKRKETPSVSTLSISYDEIMEATKEKEEVDDGSEKLYRKKRILKFVLYGVIGVILLAGIIVLAILAFGGKK